jgi:hypothetical protein
MVIDISRRARRQYQGATAFVLAVAAVAAGAFGDKKDQVIELLKLPAGRL